MHDFTFHSFPLTFISVSPQSNTVYSLDLPARISAGSEATVVWHLVRGSYTFIPLKYWEKGSKLSETVVR